MENKQYICLKCGCKKYERGEFHVSGGAASAFFDLTDTKFTTITCIECRYTEIYKAKYMRSGVEIENEYLTNLISEE